MLALFRPMEPLATWRAMMPAPADDEPESTPQVEYASADGDIYATTYGVIYAVSGA
jgi:hypothetical protein